MMVTKFNPKWIVDSLADLQKENWSESIVYRRGGITVTIEAIHPQERDEMIEESGAVVTIRSRDFIFPAADLILNGLVEKPARGDTIEWDGNIYEVLPVEGITLWEWHDSDKVQLKVHTQEVKN